MAAIAGMVDAMKEARRIVCAAPRRCLNAATTVRLDSMERLQRCPSRAVGSPSMIRTAASLMAQGAETARR